MSKQQAKPQKSQSPQGETPPDSPSVQGSLKLHGHQHGVPGAEGAINHSARYVGNVGDNMTWRTDHELVPDGPAPTSEAQRVPGSDARPAPRMKYSPGK